MVLCCVSLSLSRHTEYTLVSIIMVSFWGRGPTSRPSCVWKFNHFTNLRESTTQSYRKDDRNGVIEVEQLWFTGKLWKSIKTCWTYGSTCSSRLYFRQIKTHTTHRLGQGENGEMFQQQQKKRPPRGVVVAHGHGLECWKVFLGDTAEKCRRDDWCMLMISVASTVHP